MYSLRSFQRAAIRLTRQTSILSKPRSITTRTPSALRIKPQSTQSILYYQRRWASDEPELSRQLGEAEAVETTESEFDPEPVVSDIVPEDQNPEAVANSEAAIDAVTADAAAAETSNAVPEAKPMLESEPVADAVIAGAAATGATAAANAAAPAAGQRRSPEHDMIEKQTVYVGNLFFDVSEQDLMNEFQKFGSVAKTKIIKDNRGLSKGFGYIEFDNLPAARAAIESMHQQVYEGRRIVVAYAQQNISDSQNNAPRTSARNPPSKTLFIGNMSFEMTDRDLNNLFKEVRNVLDVRVAIDRRTGQPRGFAHADFIDVGSAQGAFDILNGKEIYGRRLRVDYSVSSGTSGRKAGGREEALRRREE